MSEYSEGDIVIVEKNETSHGFEIGEKIRIDRVHEVKGAYIASSVNNPGNVWAVWGREVRPQIDV